MEGVAENDIKINGKLSCEFFQKFVTEITDYNSKKSATQILYQNRPIPRNSSKFADPIVPKLAFKYLIYYWHS